MYLELLILIQIEKSPKHGYEIKKEIQKDLGYLMDVNHNMLYPTLRKFTDEGFVRKHRNEQEGRPNQYIYEITEAGRGKIAKLINEFTEKDAKHQIEFMVRVSLFERISQEDRIRILHRRKKDLEELLSDIERRLDESGDELFRDEVLQYSISQVNGELTWIDKLMHSVT
ncbi:MULTISPECIES: PadR family transcriptional regulator [Paenibacillus]|uniref:PadR family transcriptional regulator n=1 Tax=Paenibacillus lautus TaxID=1401 RepID=A0A1R1B0K1_PAELA|nr:PadR family transcriptional regulator [Paenibacillus lautus]OME92068.1 PadR family transcriptional regulator [Paenibacillus lautus]